MGRNGNIKRLTGVLGAVEKRLRVEEMVELHDVLKKWDQIVGPPLCDHVRPLYIRGRELFVKAEGSVWQQEFLFKKEDTIRKLNQQLGRTHIKEIRFGR